MNFQSDAQARDGYSVTFLLPDARTSVGRRYAIESADRLRALVQRTKPQSGTLDELDRDLARWDRGSVHLYLTEQEFRDLAAGKRKNLKK